MSKSFYGQTREDAEAEAREWPNFQRLKNVRIQTRMQLAPSIMGKRGDVDSFGYIATVTTTTATTHDTN